jgi:hypothetical protein
MPLFKEACCEKLNTTSPFDALRESVMQPESVHIWASLQLGDCWVCAPVMTHSRMSRHVLMTRPVSVWPKSLSCFPCLHLLDVERIYTLTECSSVDCKTVYTSSASFKPNRDAVCIQPRGAIKAALNNAVQLFWSLLASLSGSLRRRLQQPEPPK